MVVVTEKLSKSNPEAVREVFRLLAASKQAAGLPKPGSIDFLPYGFEACRPALEMMINYAMQQKLLPRPLAVDELFDDTTRALAPDSGPGGRGGVVSAQQLPARFNLDGMNWWRDTPALTRTSLPNCKAAHWTLQPFQWSISSTLPARNAYPVS